MLIRNNELHIDLRRTVQHWNKIHFKPPIRGGKRPRFHIVALIDMEFDIIELMTLPIIEKHIFARRAGVAEAIADIEAKGLPVDDPIAGAPVPAVIIGPYAAAPVECAEIRLRMKDIFLSIKDRLSARAHTVDLLVVIKCCLSLLPWRCNHHGVHRRLLECDIAGKGLTIAEIFEITADTAFPIGLDEFHRQTLIPVNDIPFDRGGGHLHLSHREGVEDGLRMLPRLCKIEQRNGLQPDIPIVGQGEGAGEPVAEHQIIIPFLNAEFRCLDRPAVIHLHQILRPARLNQTALYVQKRMPLSHLMISQIQSLLSNCPSFSIDIINNSRWKISSFS